MVTDFSTRALPISVKFCVEVWPDLGQVSYFGGIVPGIAEFWGVDRVPHGRICFLLKHLFF